MGAPFATVAVYNAILFAARGQMESMLAHADGNYLLDYANSHPSVTSLYMSPYENVLCQALGNPVNCCIDVNAYKDW